MRHIKRFEAIKDKSELENQKRFIDLSGPDGNAFNILSIARDLCKQLKDIDPKYNWDEIETEMKSGDYNNLINIFDEYFGDFVDLYQ